MEKQITTFRETGKIPIESIINAGSSIIQFLSVLFESKGQRIKDLQNICISQQKDIEDLKVLIKEIEAKVDNIISND